MTDCDWCYGKIENSVDEVIDNREKLPFSMDGLCKECFVDWLLYTVETRKMNRNRYEKSIEAAEKIVKTMEDDYEYNGSIDVKNTR